LGARDLLRLEMGYSLYGHELDENTSPLEAGLGAFVHFEHEFVGKEALLNEKEEGSKRKIIAFETRSKRAPRHGFKILQDTKEIGVVTSGVYSPKVDSGIGLGYVNVADFDETKSIQINNERGFLEAYVTDLPFYKKEK
jgi:aminomethyltransferase